MSTWAERVSLCVYLSRQGFSTSLPKQTGFPHISTWAYRVSPCLYLSRQGFSTSLPEQRGFVWSCLFLFERSWHMAFMWSGAMCLSPLLKAKWRDRMELPVAVGKEGSTVGCHDMHLLYSCRWRGSFAKGCVQKWCCGFLGMRAYLKSGPLRWAVTLCLTDSSLLGWAVAQWWSTVLIDSSLLGWAVALWWSTVLTDSSLLGWGLAHLWNLVFLVLCSS